MISLCRILYALLALLATLCILSPVYAEDTSKQSLVTVTDIAGREVQVKVPVQRMLLGEGRQLYLIASLDQENPLEYIAAWRNDLIEADPATYHQYLEKFPDLAKVPTFKGSEGSLIDIESAVVKKPDVVLLNLEAMRANEDAKYIEKLAELDIPVLYIDFRHYPLKNTDSTIRLLGKIMGREQRAEDIIAFRKQAMERVTDVLKEARPDKPKVFLERIGGYSEDCCLTFGAENFGKYVELAGGHNIGSDFLPSTFGQLSPEQVVVSNPDHVIVTSADWQAYVPGGRWIPVGPGADLDAARKKLEWYTTRDAYTGTTATKKGNFEAIWHQFYNSPYEFVAVQWIAKWLHPNLFGDLDPDKTFAEYHKRFLPIGYRPGYAVSLSTEKQK